MLEKMSQPFENGGWKCRLILFLESIGPLSHGRRTGLDRIFAIRRTGDAGRIRLRAESAKLLEQPENVRRLIDLLAETETKCSTQVTTGGSAAWSFLLSLIIIGKVLSAQRGAFPLFAALRASTRSMGLSDGRRKWAVR